MGDKEKFNLFKSMGYQCVVKKINGKTVKVWTNDIALSPKTILELIG